MPSVMSSALPNSSTPSVGAQEKRWAEYKRAIRQALDDKQAGAQAGAQLANTANAADVAKDTASTILRAVDLIGKAVGSALADQEVVQRVCAALRSAVGADFSYTIGFDPDTHTCHTLGGDELDPAKIAEVCDAKYSRAQILDSLPALAGGDQVEIDVASGTVPLAELYRSLGFQRVLHLPLPRGQELGGVQLVGRRDSRDAFDETARAILDGATPTAALALEIDRARRQLARSEQVSHYLAANISHQLRNTFSVIIGYGEILRDEARRGAQLEGTNSAMVEQVYTAARDGLEILRPVFELSNPRGVHAPVELADVAVSDLVEDLVAERFGQQRPEVGLSSDVDPALPTARTDRMMLRMMLEQILSNAQNFTLSGEVTVVAKSDGDDRIVIEIGDTGPGISEERLAAAFDALAGESASGLGLYICRQIADKLGATLDIESEVGRGTLVRVTLPPQTAA